MIHVEIWSDVACPFCYIGKRRFEQALAQFPGRDEVKVTWKSFQLAPDLVTDPSKSIYQYLAERKGWSIEQARDINKHVVSMAASSGLHYQMDKIVVTNTRNAHRLLQFAKQQGKGDALKEALLNAYFCEGKNTDDQHTLLALAKQVGLDENESRAVLESDRFNDAVDADILEAQRIGVRGVPFFVFNRSFAISGAQESDAFLEGLEKAMA
jgi:predicted DsbA family dithiol-disulfide isomerase